MLLPKGVVVCLIEGKLLANLVRNQQVLDLY